MKDRIQYGYDRAGNRTWRKNLVALENQDQHYLYDPLYQVTAAARGNLNLNQTAIGGIPAQRQTFTYDPIGNWDRYSTVEDGVETLGQHRIHNQANQITQIGGSNVGLLYDRAGNATKMPPNAEGDWSQHYKLTWDAWNRLVKVEDQDEEVVASYAYDGTTRRTTKTVGEAVTHTYYNEKWKAIEERVDESEDPHLQYLWGARPNHRDELVRRDRDADDSGSLEEKLYCLMDYFDPTSVTDEEGNVQERYQFATFGLREITTSDWTPRADSEFSVEFGFHGQFRDVASSYYNYGYRYYSPQVGRWMSRDPIGEAGGGALYAYAENSSLNLNDYLGREARRHTWIQEFVPTALISAYQFINYPNATGNLLAYTLLQSSSIQAPQIQTKKEGNICCAFFKDQAKIFTSVRSTLPKDGLGLQYTSSGYESLLIHEGKRSEAYARGAQYYENFINTQAITGGRRQYCTSQGGEGDARSTLEKYWSAVERIVSDAMFSYFRWENFVIGSRDIAAFSGGLFSGYSATHTVRDPDQSYREGPLTPEENAENTRIRGTPLNYRDIGGHFSLTNDWGNPAALLRLLPPSPKGNTGM